MKKILYGVLSVVVILITGCNNGLSSSHTSTSIPSKIDRSERTVIDSSEYIDFTMEKYDASKVRKEDILPFLSGSIYKNGNSLIEIDSRKKIIEIQSDKGVFGDKKNLQVYGKFGVEVMAASSDCLYLRRNPRAEGSLIIDNVTYVNDQIPDLAVCLPLYGYSKNRIEVSPLMNGFIVMPSGTYWKR